MSKTTTVRVLAFASPEEGVWGGLVSGAAGTALVLGAGDVREAVGRRHRELRCEHGCLVGFGGRDERDRRSHPRARVPQAPPHDPDLGEPAQPCTVRGSVTVSGAMLEIDCEGLRLTLSDLDVRDAGSLRAVAGWFGPELSLALGALRPRGSRGHEHDRLTATLFEAGLPRMVDEPRLSTTVRDDGLPARMSMELWVAEGDDLYPRRAAGEAAASGVRTPSGTPRLGVVPMTCHMAGLDGAGVYLLADLA